MEIGLYEAVSGMKAQASQQDMISSNLARMSIPGNKRSITAFEIPSDSDLQKSSNIPGQVRRLGMKASPLQARTVTDFTPAPLEHTGSNFDFAILGNGFFKVKEADGSFSYTRNGQFHVTNEGKLVTLDGAQVVNNGDTPLTIPAKDSSKVKLGDDGTLTMLDGNKSTKLGSLSMVNIDEPRKSLYLGAPNGRYVVSPDAPNAAADVKSGMAKGATIVQGSLESSNANSVSEMVSLVNVVRAYEASQKITQAEDTLSGDIIHAMNATS